MKEQQENIDELIKKALSEEESEILERLGEQSILDQVMATFQGRMKWIAIYSAVMIFIIFALSVYSFIQFLNAEEIRDMLLWGAGMGMGMMAVGLLKTWHWMQMDKNSIMREIKRLELHIAALHKNKG